MGQGLEIAMDEFDTIAKIVEQLEWCNYENEAGGLNNNIAFLALKRMAGIPLEIPLTQSESKSDLIGLPVAEKITGLKKLTANGETLQLQVVFITIPDLQLMLDSYSQRIIKAFTEQSASATQADQWFDLNGLCAYLPDKPAKQTLYDRLSAGEIPGHKKGKKWIFLKSEIDAWLKTGRKKTNAELGNEADVYLLSKNKKGAL